MLMYGRGGGGLCIYGIAQIEEGADVNFVFGSAYSCKEGYTPLMAAAHRGRYECCKALLRSGADPNFCNNADDVVLFWGIDGGAFSHPRHIAIVAMKNCV